MNRMIVVAAAAVLACACTGSRTTLDLKDLGHPEEVAALALLDDAKVVAVAGDGAHVVERTGGQLLDSGVPLLRDTRLPGTSREVRSAEYRIAGATGQAYLDVRTERRNNGRWRVAKWSVLSPADRDRMVAEGNPPLP